MWIERKSPERIEKRFEFDTYQEISLFMETIEALCKEHDIYPNISFGTSFVSVTIFIDSKETSRKSSEFSRFIDESYKR